MLDINQQLPLNIDSNTFVDPNVTNIVLPNTFEEKFEKLLNQPLPKPFSINVNPDIIKKPYKTEYSDGLEFRNLFQKTQQDLRNTDPTFNNPKNKMFSSDFSEIEPYVHSSSNYDSQIGAAFGQAGKGAVVGGLLGTATGAVGFGTLVGAGIGGAAGFLSGLLGKSGREGYLLGIDNQKYYSDLQSGVLNRITGFGNNVIDRAFESSIGGTAALLATPFGAISGKDFYAWGNNPLSERLTKGIEKSEFKAHLSQNYLDKGPFAKFFTGEGFQNEVADMLGFTLGMMAGVKGQGMLNRGAGELISRTVPNLSKSIASRGGNLIGQLTPTLAKETSSLFLKGTKNLVGTQNLTFGSLVDETKNLFTNPNSFKEYGVKLANAFQEGGYGLKALSALERTGLASYGEARIEAASSYNDVYEEAIRRGFSEQEAVEKATKAANKTLGMNILLLSVTNQFGLNQLTKGSALKNLSNWFTKEWVFDGSTKTLMKNILSSVPKKAAEGFVYEGFAEELGQFAISEGAKNQQLNAVNTSFLPEFIDAYKEALFSDEGISNWFGGGLFGATMGMLGLDGGILGIMSNRKEAKSLTIPQSLRTQLSNFTGAVQKLSKHVVPFNNQLFQSYSKDQTDPTKLVPDNNGTIRLLEDPLRVVKLTQALSNLNTLSSEQASYILTDLKAALKSDNADIVKGAKVISDYLNTLSKDKVDDAKNTLQEYLNKNVSDVEKRNTLFLLSSLSKQDKNFEEKMIDDLSSHMLKSNYVYDYVSNGVEDMLFDELDLLENSLSDKNSEAFKKDEFEFFGKLYKQTEFDNASKDIEQFRKDLKYQVDMFKSIYNRYGDPLTHISLKNKNGESVIVPVTVDLKEVMRSAIREDYLKKSLDDLSAEQNRLETDLLSDPKFKSEYLNVLKTSEDVIDKALGSFGKNPKVKELKQNLMLNKYIQDAIINEQKHFAKLTDKKQLIKELLEAERVFNETVENPPVLNETDLEETFTEEESEFIPTETEEEDNINEVPFEESTKEEVKPEESKPEVVVSETSEDKQETEETLEEQPSEEELYEETDVNDVLNESPGTPIIYDEFSPKTPFSPMALFKTYADTTNRSVALNSFLNDYVKQKTGDFALLPIALDSEIGKKILNTNVSDKEYYSKNGYPKVKELIYLVVNENKEVLLENNQVYPLKNLFGSEEVPSDVKFIFQKSGSFYNEGGEWKFGNGQPLSNKFSQLDAYSKEEIDNAVQTHVNFINNLYDNAPKVFSDIAPTSTLSIVGKSEGVEYNFETRKEKALVPVKIKIVKEKNTLVIVDKQVAEETGFKKGSLKVKSVQKDGTVKYYSTHRSPLNHSLADHAFNLLSKAFGKTITSEETETLQKIVNYVDLNDPTLTYAKRFAKNVIYVDPETNRLVIYGTSVHSLSLDLEKKEDRIKLKEALLKYYLHIDKNLLTSEKEFTSPIDGKSSTYAEFLTDNGFVKQKTSNGNLDLPTRANVQLFFDPKLDLDSGKRSVSVSISALRKNESLFKDGFFQKMLLERLEKPFLAEKIVSDGDFEKFTLSQGFKVIVTENAFVKDDVSGELVEKTYQVNHRTRNLVPQDLLNHNVRILPVTEETDSFVKTYEIILTRTKGKTEWDTLTLIEQAPIKAEEKIVVTETPIESVQPEDSSTSTTQTENNSTFSDVNIVSSKSDDIIKELNKLKTPQEKLNWLKEKRLITPIIINGKSYNSIDYSDRIMVFAKFGKYNIPFYLSTGQAGKKNVKAGEWYVVFGIGKEGWINKGSAEQINNQYGFPIFQKFAKILNEGIGTFESRENNGNGKIIEGIGYLEDSKIFIDEFNSQMNLSIVPAKNHKESDIFYSNVNKILVLINDELQNISNSELFKNDQRESNEDDNYRILNNLDGEIENIEEFKQWLNEVLPMFSVIVEKEFIDGKAQGQLFKNLIRLYENAGKGTGFHEAFEAVWAYFLTSQQKQTLINEFKSRKGSFKYYSDQRIINYSEATDYEAKEMLAEGMIDFMKNKKLQSNSPVANNFFIKMWNFIKDFINSILKYFKSTQDAYDTIEKVYEALAAGKFKDRTITEFDALANRDRFSGFTDIVTADLVYFEKLLHDRFVEEVFEKTGNYNIYDLIESAQEDSGSIANFVSSKLDTIYDQFCNDFLEAVKYAKENNTPNKSLIVNGMTEKNVSTGSYSFVEKNGLSLKDVLKRRYVETFMKKTKLSAFLTQDDLEESNKKSKEGITAANETNPSANINNNVRFLLSSLYQYEFGDKKVLNEFSNGIKEYELVDAEKAEKTLRALLTNLVPHYYKFNGEEKVHSLREVMLMTLRSKAKDPKFHWIHDLISKLKLDKPVLSLSENEHELQLSFINAFKKAEHIPLNYVASEHGVKFRNAIVEGNVLNIISNWKSLLLKKGSQNAEGEVVIPVPSEKDIEKPWVYFTEKLGLDFGQYTNEKNAQLHQLLDDLYTNLHYSSYDPVTYVSVKHIFSTNRYLIPLELVAKRKAEENSMYEKSFTNYDGKQQYSVTNPTALSDFFNIMNNVESIEHLLLSIPHLTQNGKIKVGLENNLFLRGENDFSSSSRMRINPFFRSGKEGNRLVNQYLFNGVRDSSRDTGTSFSKLSEYDKLLFKLNAFLQKGAFSLPINSDKNMENAVSFSDRPIIDLKEYWQKPNDYTAIIKDYFLPLLKDEIQVLLRSNATDIAVFGSQLSKKQLGYFQDIVNFTEEDYNNLKSKSISLETFVQSKIQNIQDYLTTRIKETTKELKKADVAKYIPANVLAERLPSAVMEHLPYIVQAVLNDTEGLNYNNKFGVPNFLEKITDVKKKEEESLAFMLKHMDTLYSDVSKKGRTSNQIKLINAVHNYMGKHWTMDVVQSTLEVLEEEIKVNSLNAIIPQFVINYWIFNVNIQNLMYGSPLFYAKDEFAKRASFVASAKQPVENSEETNSYMDMVMSRFDSRRRDGNLHYVSYQDPISVSPSISSFAEGMRTSLKALRPGITESEISAVVGATFDKKGNFKALLDDMSSTQLETYTKLKLADAQAFLMPDGTFDLLYKSAKLTPDQKRQFKYEFAYERLERSKLKGSLRYTYKDASLKKQDEEIVKLGNPNVVIQVFKPQGSGYSLDTNTVVPIFLKNSAAPLFWSRVENNPQLRELYVKWQKEGIDLIGFGSGQKLGNVQTNGKLISLIDNTGKANLKELPYVQKMKHDFFGLQVETANEFKKKVTRGVQITKLVTANLMLFYKKPGYEKITQLIDDYYSNLNELWNRGYDELTKKLGIVYNDLTNTYEIENLEYLVDTLKQEVARLNLPINIEDMFIVDEKTGQLPYSLDASTERNRIEYILTSILDSSLIHQKVKGTQSPQISSVFEGLLKNGKGVYLKNGKYEEIVDFNSLSEKEKKSAKLTSDELRILEDGTIEVLLPSYLKGVINISDVTDNRLLNVIGYRIPTQSLGQVEKIRVKGFLPDSYGDSIVVPMEIVGKAGSDFDIDKLTLYFPHYFLHKNGEPTYVEYSTKPEEQQYRYITYIKSKEKDLFLEEKKAMQEALRDFRKESGLAELSDKQKSLLKDVFTENSEFHNLALPIKQQFWNYETELVDQKVIGLNKVIHYKEYVTNWISSLENRSEKTLSLNLLNRKTKQVEKSEISVKKELKILRKLLSEYDESLMKIGFNSEMLYNLNKLIEEYKEYKEDVFVSDFDRAVGMAKVKDLISFDDFIQLPLAQQNTKEALENRNIEIMSELIALPENRLQHLSPNSADTIKSIDTLLYGNNESVSNSLLPDVLASTQLRHTLIYAKNLVGAGALNVTGHAVAQISGITIDKKYNFLLPSFLFNDKRNLEKTEIRLDQTFDEKGIMISSNLSEFLSAFVDAAKDPFAVRLNLNGNTVNEAFLLIRSGLSIEKTLMFLNQHTIKYFIKRIEEETSIFKKSTSDSLSKKLVLANTLVDYFSILANKGQLPSVDGLFNAIENIKAVNKYAWAEKVIEYSNLEINKLLQKKHKNFYSIDNLHKGTQTELPKKSGIDLQDGLIISIKALLDFDKMGPISSELSDVNSILNIESSYTKTLVDNEILLEKTLKELKYIKNVEKAFSKTHLRTVGKFRSRFKDYLRPFLLTADEKFVSLLKDAQQRLLKQRLGKEATSRYLNKFTNFILTYMIREQEDSTYIQNLLDNYSDTSLVSKILYLKENFPDQYKKFGKPFDNLGIEHTNNDKTINIKLLINKEDIVIKNTEILKYEGLYEKALKKNPNASAKLMEFYIRSEEIFNDLVKVSLHQAGVFQSPVSLASTLPSELYSKQITEVLENFDVNTLEFEKLWEMFHQNFWSDSSVVPFRNSNVEYDGITGMAYIRGDIKSDFVRINSKELFTDDDTGEVDVYNLQSIYKVLSNEYSMETENGLEKVTIIHPIPKLGNRTTKGALTFGYEITTGDSYYNEDILRVDYDPLLLENFKLSLQKTSDVMIDEQLPETEGTSSLEMISEEEPTPISEDLELLTMAFDNINDDQKLHLLTYMNDTFNKTSFMQLNDVEISLLQEELNKITC